MCPAWRAYLCAVSQEEESEDESEEEGAVSGGVVADSHAAASMGLWVPLRSFSTQPGQASPRRGKHDKVEGEFDGGPAGGGGMTADKLIEDLELVDSDAPSLVKVKINTPTRLPRGRGRDLLFKIPAPH